MLVLVSFVLVLAAAVTLVVGLLQSGLTLIYLSIGCSVLAGVVLAVAVLRGRPEPKAAAPVGRAYTPPASAPPAPATTSTYEPATTSTYEPATTSTYEPAPAPATSYTPPPPPPPPTPAPAPPSDDAAIKAAGTALLGRLRRNRGEERVPQPTTAEPMTMQMPVTSAESDDGFPIADYDSLRATDLLRRLGPLDRNQLEAVRDRETGRQEPLHHPQPHRHPAGGQGGAGLGGRRGRVGGRADRRRRRRRRLRRRRVRRRRDRGRRGRRVRRRPGAPGGVRRRPGHRHRLRRRRGVRRAGLAGRRLPDRRLRLADRRPDPPAAERPRRRRAGPGPGRASRRAGPAARSSTGSTGSLPSRGLLARARRSVRTAPARKAAAPRKARAAKAIPVPPPPPPAPAKKRAAKKARHRHARRPGSGAPQGPGQEDHGRHPRAAGDFDIAGQASQEGRRRPARPRGPARSRRPPRPRSPRP